MADHRPEFKRSTAVAAGAPVHGPASGATPAPRAKLQTATNANHPERESKLYR
jgi:hypothetical protein